MKKILQIVDCEGWAIDTLAKAIVLNNPHYEWRRIFIHPKDLEFGKVDLEKIKFDIQWADIIDAQYWRTLSQLAEKIPEIKDKKIILTHHNEKNLLSEKWDYVDMHIAKTNYSVKQLLTEYDPSKVTYIANSFDPNVFQYNEQFPPKERCVGYVGRIAPWKGLKGLAKACYETGYKLMVMGKHDKMSYFEEIPKEHRDIIDWSFFNCEDSDRANFYKHITCYVGYSGSGREVGTLGFIEALATGVPVITTHAGLAEDIGVHDENMLMVDYDDIDELKETLTRLMESPSLQMKIRKNGWDTIRNLNDYRMSMQYRKVFDRILNCGFPVVSVIIPSTYDREENVEKIIEALKAQTYKAIEAVIIWDEVLNGYTPREFKAPFPVKQLVTNQEGYNLAMARNIGVIEADGELLMFCDSRLKPLPNAIESFLKHIPVDKDEKVWLFGDKGGEKKHFVENFTMIRREHLIRAGMFNERIQKYGGMSQELRERFAWQDFKLTYVPEAEAEQMLKSGMNNKKRCEIIDSKNLLYKLGY